MEPNLHPQSSNRSPGPGDAPPAIREQQERVQRLFLRHSPALEGFVHAVIPHREDADDVYQQAFLTMVDKAAEYDPDQPFRPWGFGIIKGVIRSWLRDHNRRSQRMISLEVVEILSDGAAARPIRESDDFDLLRKCLSRLTTTAQRLLRMHYFNGKSGQEISDHLGIKARSVYVGLNRARGVLRKCIAQERALVARRFDS